MAKPIIHKAIENDSLSPGKRLNLGLVHNTRIMQPKHDGCFGMVTPFCDIRTRTGETIRSCDHIVRAMQAVVKNLRQEFYFLGELWIPGMPQAEISGRVRQHAPAPDMQFIVFDALTSSEFGMLVPAELYSRRYRKRVVYASLGDTSGSVRCIDSFNPGTYGSVADALREYTQRRTGYDGIILRDPDGGWKVGSGSGGEIVKIKPTTTKDLLITGVVEGNGKYAGMAGKLQFKWTRGRTLEASGGTNAERLAWFRDPSTVVGKIGEVEAMAFTEDGMLREPRFKGIRLDKEGPDV